MNNRSPVRHALSGDQDGKSNRVNIHSLFQTPINTIMVEREG